MPKKEINVEKNGEVVNLSNAPSVPENTLRDYTIVQNDEMEVPDAAAQSPDEHEQATQQTTACGCPLLLRMLTDKKSNLDLETAGFPQDGTPRLPGRNSKTLNVSNDNHLVIQNHGTHTGTLEANADARRNPSLVDEALGTVPQQKPCRARNNKNTTRIMRSGESSNAIPQNQSPQIRVVHLPGIRKVANIERFDTQQQNKIAPRQDQQIVQKHNNPFNADKSLGEGENSDENPQNLSQPTKNPYAKQLRASQAIFNRMQEERNEYRSLFQKLFGDQQIRDFAAKMEKMERNTLQKDQMISFLEETIEQKDEQIAQIKLDFQHFFAELSNTAAGHDAKMKDMEEKLEKATQIRDEMEKRHQEDQREKVELQRQLDVIRFNQNMFTTVLNVSATQLLNQPGAEPTTSTPVSEAIGKFWMECMEQDKTSHKRQADSIDDSAEKKKVRIDDNEESK